ncbi:hypothetical protein [Streptomyces griseus]|uniref:hypothetical protein n=1 Tax=Streptomyces griseus TaxID=1911 RepID=UPI0036562C54
MPQNPTPAAAGDTNPTTNLTPEREAEIRADLAAVPAPPWRWIGLRGAGGPQLVTDHSGREYLLRAAKPSDHRDDELLDPETDAVVYGDLEFRDQREGETYSWMRSGNSLAVGRTEYDPDSIVGVANPIARWVEKSAQHVTDLLAEVDALRARVAKLETALAATGRSLSSFIFDADDPGVDALGAQWLYWQAMPLADDPFVQPRAFRSSVFSEASKAVEEMDGNTPSEHSQAYLDGYSDGLLDASERLEKLADQAAEGNEPTSAPSQREAGAL